MGYIYLTISIICELLGTSALKYSDGFSKVLPSFITVTSYLIAFYFLAKSLQHINLSIAYATWAGLGVVAATVISVLVFKEQINLIGVAGIAFVVVGLTLLNFYGTAH